jgi:hypothetical protein
MGKAESLCCNYILIDMKILKAKYDYFLMEYLMGVENTRKVVGF